MSEGSQEGESAPKVRTTVDLPREVNRELRRYALERDTSLQAVFGALAQAVVDGDQRVLEALHDRL